ncbi:MAG: hypothetical protein ACKVOK_10870, partial [Flavobacteriales bacterium]
MTRLAVLWGLGQKKEVKKGRLRRPFFTSFFCYLFCAMTLVISQRSKESAISATYAIHHPPPYRPSTALPCHSAAQQGICHQCTVRLSRPP